jgi:membrane-bound lytic murein transglycosylase B
MQVRLLPVLLAALVALGSAGIALAAIVSPDERSSEAGAPARAPAPPLPAPDAALPRDASALAATLTETSRRLRAELARWQSGGDFARGGPPEAVTLLALHHQRLHRRLATARRLGDRVLAGLPADVRGEARDIVLARRALAAIPRRGAPPPVRTAAAEPAGVLRGAYAAAARRFGVPWDVLAAINFVESAFGRVRSASEAGARGPMQFLPATWRRYGMGGDIDDARDAILAAANYLRASGAPRDIRGALFAYNHSTHYVSGVLRLARRMRRDERAFLTLYAWQVYARTPSGTRRLTGPGRE